MDSPTGRWSIRVAFVLTLALCLYLAHDLGYSRGLLRGRDEGGKYLENVAADESDKLAQKVATLATTRGE